MKNIKKILLSILVVGALYQSEMHGMLRKFSTRPRTQLVLPVAAAVPTFSQRYLFTGGGYKHYKVLNLPTNATKKQIRDQYLKLVMTYHPDGGGSPEKFRELQEAYKELMKLVPDTEEETKSTKNQEPIFKSKTTEQESSVDVEEALLKLDVESYPSFIDLLKKEGKAKKLDNFCKKYHQDIEKKLLQKLKLYSHNIIRFLDLFKTIKEIGFDGSEFVNTYKQILQNAAIETFKTGTMSFYKDLNKILDHKIFESVEQFVDAFVAQTSQQPIFKYRLVKSFMNVFANNIFNIETFVIAGFKQSFNVATFEQAMKIYEYAFQKGYCLGIDDHILSAYVGIIKDILQHGIVQPLMFDKYFRELKQMFEMLPKLLNKNIIASRESLLAILKGDFEQALEKVSTESKDNDQKLLDLLQSEGVVLDINLNELGVSTVHFDINKVFKSIKDGRLYQASEQFHQTPKEQKSQAIKDIMNRMFMALSCAEAIEQKYGLNLLHFLLSNNLVTLENLMKMSQFALKMNKEAILLLFENCETLDDYKNVTRIVEALDNRDIVRKGILIKEVTLLMLAKNNKNFQDKFFNMNSSFFTYQGFEHWIDVVKLLHSKQLIDETILFEQSATFISTKCLNMLIKKNEDFSHYDYVIKILRLAIKENFIDLHEFLKLLANCADLTLEEKEAFKQLLL